MSDYDISAKIKQAAYNPESWQRVALDYIQSRLNGDTLPDVNNPLVQLLEVSSAQAIEHITENFSLDRKHYALLAQTYSDLYGHMADADYLDRFSDPGMVTIQYIVELDSLVAAMVEVSDTALKKVVIPRYTMINPGGEYPLTLLYPIEIRQLPHDGIQVVYNTDNTSPIQTLTDNLLDFRYITTSDGTKYLQIDIPLFQLERTITLEQVITAKSRFAFAFTDDYFYCRVFQGSAGAWTELETTHSLQVYDANTPTAVLQVGDGVLNVTIPPIYYTNGTISGNLRVDIYTTQGDVVKDLTNFDTSTYLYTWGDDTDDTTLANYSAGLTSLPFAFSSTDTLEGGTDGLTFAEQRDRVIQNTDPSQIAMPITTAQITAKLNRLGFDIVLSRDDITERLYLATVTMPVSPTSSFTSGVGVTMATIQTSIDKLVSLAEVKDNGDRVTITPDTLFSYTNGVLAIVDDSLRPDVTNSTPETFVNALNNSTYGYTPFHYVLDTTESDFSMRAYYLNNPSQTSRRFVLDNATLLIEVNTSGFNIAKTATGYRLTVTITGGTSYTSLDTDQRFMQLAFIPTGQTDYAYLNGTYVGTTGTTVVWQFDIKTNFDLDSNDDLIVTNFAMYEADPKDFSLPLNTEFLLLNIIGNYTVDNYTATAIDSLLGTSLLPSDAKGLTEEFVTLELGTALDNMWRGARTLAGSYTYKSYAVDVYATYSADVYKIDPSTNLPEYTVNSDGSITLTTLHKAGDTQLDVDGNPVVLHKAGDPVLDSNGDPVPVSDRPVTRIIDLFIMDGKYYYVTNSTDVADADYVPETIADTLLPKIDNIPKLEKTDVYFYPKKTLGAISIIVDDGVEKTIVSGLSFTVKYYLTGTAYRDEDYKTNLQTATSKVINTGVKLSVVSVSKLIDLISDITDDNVIGFELDMYAGSDSITTFTVSDSSVSASVNRLIEYGDDGKYEINEDISYVWKNHDVATTN